VSVNGRPLPAALAPISDETRLELRQLDLSRHLVAGRNVVDVTIGGDIRLSVQVAGRYVLPCPRRRPP